MLSLSSWNAIIFFIEDPFKSMKQYHGEDGDFFWKVQGKWWKIYSTLKKSAMWEDKSTQDGSGVGEFSFRNMFQTNDKNAY